MTTKSFRSKIIYAEITPPEDGPTFEKICLDSLPFFLKKHNVKIINKNKKYYSIIYGTNGDRQNGVDIIEYATYSTAQCKNQKKLTQKDVSDELNKLRKYDGYSTFHFFFSSLNGIPVKITEYIDAINEESNKKPINPKLGNPTKPKYRMPTVVMINWIEINEAIHSNLWHSIKWGAAPGISSNYPLLVTLDLELLIEICKKTERNIQETKIIGTPESNDPFLALTRDINFDDILQFEQSGIITSKTFNEITEFLRQYHDAHAMAVDFEETLRLCNSTDGIEAKEGLERLNRTAELMSRIRIIPFITELKLLLEWFIKTYDIDESYYHPNIELESPYGEYVTIEDWSIREYRFIDSASDIEDGHFTHYHCKKRIKEFTEKIRATLQKLHKELVFKN